MSHRPAKHQILFIRISVLTTCVITSTTCWAAATISLKAVAKNGVAIAPTNAISVTQNDTITAEIWIFGWNSPPFDSPSNTGLVQTYEATLFGRDGVVSNGSDGTVNAELVLPVGWDAPIVQDACPCSNPLYPVCNLAFSSNRCVGATFSPERMVRVCVGGARAGLDCAVNADCTGGGTCPEFNILRPDYIFYLYDTIRATDISSLDVRWGGTINGADGQTTSRCQGGTAAGAQCTLAAHCPGGTCNADFISYAGSLNLKVGAEACGTYTFNFDPGASFAPRTYLCNTAAAPICKLPALEGLTVMVGGGTAPHCDDGIECTVDTCNPDRSCTHDDSGCSIPTVSQWGLVVLTIVLLVAAKVQFGRRKPV
jgi:hypothetical protein